jgi:hypothetical protein
MIKVNNKQPMICAYCKKIIYKDKHCFEKHSGKFYHADCKLKKEKLE